MSDEPTPITMYSSWRSLFTGIVSPAILIAFGAISMVWAGKVALVAGVVLTLGIVLGLVTLIDMPRRVVLNADGIHRRCLLRSQHLPWTSVAALARAPGPLLSGGRSTTGRAVGRSHGGLTAIVGSRKYLLIDVCESREEYDEIARAARSWSPALALSASRPEESMPPTWLYHQRHRKA